MIDPNYRQWLRNWPDLIGDEPEKVIDWLDACPEGKYIVVVGVDEEDLLFRRQGDGLWQPDEGDQDKPLTSQDIYLLWGETAHPEGLYPDLDLQDVRDLSLSRGCCPCAPKEPEETRMEIGVNTKTLTLALRFPSPLQGILLDIPQATYLCDVLQKALAELRLHLN